MLKKGKILLTGASGFVGYHLVKEAVARGFEVFAAVRKSSQTAHLSAFPVQYVYPDFQDINSLKQEMQQQQYDYIIHAAAATRASSQESFNNANADITRNLAIAASEAGIPLKKFIFISSLAVLGPIAYDRTEPIREDHFPQPITGYGRSKLLAEQYLAAYKELPLLTLRPTIVYGPREKDLYIMIRTLSRGLEPYIGRGNQLLSFVFVTDLVKVILDALPLTTPNGLTCNISDGKVYDRYEVASVIKYFLNKKTFRFYVPVGVARGLAVVMETIYAQSRKKPLLYRERVGEIIAPNWNTSIDQARRHLHYQPEYDLKKGMQESIAWYKEHRWLR